MYKNVLLQYFVMLRFIKADLLIAFASIYCIGFHDLKVIFNFKRFIKVFNEYYFRVWNVPSK